MRIKLDQGTLPRLMNRSLNRQNPKTRPRCCHSFLHSGYLPGLFRSRGEHCPAPAPSTSAGSPQIGAERLTLLKHLHITPDSTSGWGRSQAAQKCPHADSFVFYIKMCISAHCRHLQHLQEHRCEADNLPPFWKSEL